jgi:GT2 family glycosyltransferase
MKIVAVVPAWRAIERLPAVLDSLIDQVAVTVVVDNGSGDGSVEWLSSRAAVRVIANSENLGFAAAANQGLERALELGGEGVLLVNDDAVFRPDSVAALARALTGASDAAAATPKMRYADRPEILNGTGGMWDPMRGWAALRGDGETDVGQYDRLTEADYPSGGCALLSSRAIREIGVFDPEYYLYYEDVDWGLRAARAGWRTLYVADAEVLHGGSRSTASDPARRRYYNVRNRLRFVGRHCSAIGRCYAWLSTLSLLAKQPFRYPFPDRRREALAVAWGVRDHLSRSYGRSPIFG